MEFSVGKVGINLGGYGIFLGDKGSLSVYRSTSTHSEPFRLNLGERRMQIGEKQKLG